MMDHPGFFERAGPFPLRVVAERTQAELAPGADPDRVLTDVKTLSDAGLSDLGFFDNKKYLAQMQATSAGACLVQPAFAARLPAGCAGLVTRQPYQGFARALALFYPEAARSKPAMAAGHEPRVHPTARIEADVRIEPGAVIGREAWIGRGTVVAAGAVVGYRVTIGRDSWIGPGATVIHALIGDRVILHGGVRIGQDGFGFAMGAAHLKVPQIGRVIIQEDVEIGANSCVDRGALKDTVIGAGTKIDNLVQIGHNVVIGRHCVIVGQVGIAGSSVLEDYVVIGGQGGVAGHLRVGTGAQLAGASHAKDDIPAKARYVGTPAIPLRDWVKAQRAIRKQAGIAAGADDDAG
jgi:UDP-3-O-[3-hydroxymyristoyl] glucosamine N-acyltransferase